MTAPALRPPGGAYEGAGRQAAVALRGFSSVIVTSDDIIAAAHAAIGIALTESTHRLTMVADLGDDTPPLQSLIRDDDPHGVYDSFEFGTSFVRIAREVEGAKNFYVMPSGTESPAAERILSSDRWAGFASQFATADELLLLVVASDTPGLSKLAQQVDGVVLVGIQRLDNAPSANILAKIPHPAIVAPPKIDLAPRKEELPVRRFALIGAALLAVGIAVGAWIGRSSKEEPQPQAIAPVDSAPVDSAPPRRPVVTAANPADSASAPQFSVFISASNTLEGANLEMKSYGSALPAATISLVPIGDTEAIWYKIYAGVYDDSTEADRLLATLRRRRSLPDSGEAVLRAPLALLIDSIPAQAGMTSRIRERIQALSEKDVKAYALRQSDGSARIYSGAFVTPDESTLAATALRVAGLTPVLVYKTGRMR